MTIGIDASRAFLAKRTGIEEYSYQVIKHLRNELAGEQVVLYVRRNTGITNYELRITNENSKRMLKIENCELEIPLGWEVKELWGPRLWTQGRLALEMWLHPPDALFVPAHTVPWIHPRETVVTVHGLEYEFCPEAYSRWERFYMRWSIKHSCRWASRIIAVSENTKRDLMKLYGVPEEKIRVVYEGVGQIKNEKLKMKNEDDFKEQGAMNREQRGAKLSTTNYRLLTPHPYFLFIGRIEARKNVARMLEAFDAFKKKCGTDHMLVLAGKPGFGYGEIQNAKLKMKNSKDILELGYVSEEERWELLRNAEGFLFPSLYEGFGLPILEAQSVGVPVLTSTTSSLPEVAGGPARNASRSDAGGGVFVNPESVEDIALGIEKLALDRGFRSAIIEGGRKNVDRFSWEKCAREIVGLLTG